MKIEFRSVGDGTNIEVLLVEDISGYEIVVDRVFTADHKGGIWYGEDRGVSVSARSLFEWVEDSWLPPVIGGKYAYAHPYWKEREEKRKRREALRA